MTKIRNLSLHDEPVVTVAELAEYWRVTQKTIYRHIEKGALEVRRLPGGDIRIPIEAARNYGRPTADPVDRRRHSRTPVVTGPKTP